MILVLCLCCVALLEKCNMRRPVDLLEVLGIETLGMILSDSIEHFDMSVPFVQVL